MSNHTSQTEGKPMMATIYQCSNRSYATTQRCIVHNLGKRDKCPGCKSRVYAIAGHAVVLEHRGDGRYTLSEAVKEYATYAAAEKAAMRAYELDNQSNLVARFLIA